jgi:hypothetical protein
MSNAATQQPSKAAGPAQPTFWQTYSPRGELPLSFTASALLYSVAVTVVILAGALFVATRPTGKPVQMDVVEIEGYGGGLGGVSSGPGLNSEGKAGKSEGALKGKGGQTSAGKIADVQFKEIPLKDQKLRDSEGTEIPLAEYGDVFAELKAEQDRGQKILTSQIGDGKTGDAPDGFKGGVKNGPPGGAGGPKGKGLGNNPKGGDGRGKSPYGTTLTDQQRYSLRWRINASYSGEEHLKKLIALKVTLILPIPGSKGMALSYDLGKGSLRPETIKFMPEKNKVCWMNAHKQEMVSLAKQLHLSDIPPFAVIILPTELETSMARRELEYQGKQENEIELTVWDVRLVDGAYENQPYIVEQRLYKK